MSLEFPSSHHQEEQGGVSASLIWRSYDATAAWVVTVFAKYEGGGEALLGRLTVTPGLDARVIGFASAPGCTALVFEATQTGATGRPRAKLSCVFEPARQSVGGPVGLWASPYAVVGP